MTDVNIATEMLVDAFRDRFDVALLISGDSDLTPPVQAVQSLFPRESIAGKSVVVAFPPARVSKRLRAVANASFTIGRKKLAESQFPCEVVLANGYRIHRPETWR